MQKRSNIAGLVVFLGFMGLLLLCTFSSSLINFYTDFLWFETLGFEQILVTRITTSVGLIASFGLVATGFLLFNWNLLPHWIAPQGQLHAKIPLKNSSVPGQTVHQDVSISARPLRLALTVLAVLIGVGVGLSAGGLWRTYLLAREGAAFNLTDPIFNRDIGYYIFQLPWQQELLGYAKTLLTLTLLGAVARYTLFKQLKERGATAHLSLMGALWLALYGVGWLIERYSLLQAHTGVVFGAGYTDVNARLLLYDAQAIIFFVAAGLLVLNGLIRQWKLLLGVVIFWGAVSIIGPIYPALVQSFVVEPNEFALERPYIEHNIRYTRYAYGLHEVREHDYPALGSLTEADLETYSDIFRNIRLWDYRPLLRTYSQLQEIRLYYTFNEVDIDRYVINGELRQVMLAARELDVDDLAEQAQTWLNRHLIFTHGYGLALSPVNEVSPEGLPNLLVRDIPAISAAPELELTRPQIYFGESTHQYVIINTTEDEFHYPVGSTNAYTRYTGPDGVPIGGLFRRILLALRFNSSQLLLSPALTSESRILFHRTVRGRARTIAPMLWLDDDPYPVIMDGKIVWLLDAYTWSDHFPYAEPLGGVNYIRNSVKIALDAYTGEMTFYLIDPEEPIAATYARIFPDLFRPVEEMPATLRAHWRYPETLFLYQSQMYGTYHMHDPQVFYNREDLWDVPRETVAGGQQAMEPYYVLMRSPDTDELEFMLIRPYVPSQRQNMVAWLYAKSDGDNYGQLGVYRLGKDRMIYGPQQIEGRADQDPLISQQLTLWDQRGSRVLRGNLLVVPIKDTFIYVEPIYLESEASRLPELRRVIVAYEDRVVMAPTLEEALLQVLGAAPIEEGVALPPLIGDMESLAAQAWEHYQTAQTCLAAGDWTCYGRAQAALEEVLRAMVGGEETP